MSSDNKPGDPNDSVSAATAGVPTAERRAPLDMADDVQTAERGAPLGWLCRLLIVIAAVVQLSRILQVQSSTGEVPFFSANDRSRWCTIASLAVNGSYEIDDVLEIRDPSTRDAPGTASTSCDIVGPMASNTTTAANHLCSPHSTPACISRFAM